VLCNYLVFGEKVFKSDPNEDEFYVARPLGRGAFGAVSLTFKKDTGKPFATKIMNKVIAKSNKMINDVLVEHEILSAISLRFCVNLHYAYQTKKNEVALTLTLMPGGDLAFLLQSRYPENKKKEKIFNPLPDGLVKFYAASMALGLQAVHDAGYVYRDLKPQNVLLDVNGQVRISDMGLTHRIKEGGISQKSGTRGYWSPETVLKQKYTTEPDWWSLGVTMYVLQSDKMPFKGKTDEEKDEATANATYEFSHGEPADLQEVVSALLTIDTSKRLGCNGGVAELKKHKYFAGFDWAALEAGEMEAIYKPNPNDINAPSKKDIEAFKAPKDVSWEAEDEEKFKKWSYMNKELWFEEAEFRIGSKKEIGGGGGGGGGCCVIA